MGPVMEQVWRDERARIVASVARRFCDLTLAEDAVQEAFAAASARWPVDGTPERPGAWLQVTSYRKAVSLMRKRPATIGLDQDIADTAGQVTGDSMIGQSLDQDLFGLMFTCCHPSLRREARVALTLRHVCGLTNHEIASAFVISEPTMAKRLVRARRKIKDAGISFDPPDKQALLDRIPDVHTVIYVVFTEGHLSSATGQTVRGDLCDEAIWLTRQLLRLQPTDAETRGLLALLLIQHARTNARQQHDGHLITLPDQDRARWDDRAIAEARQLLGRTGSDAVGPYQVEAAIALLHVVADHPNWRQIAGLYDVLSRLAPSPIVDVNRALAVGRAAGPHAGLAIIEPVVAEGRLDTYPSAYAVHADLLEKVGHIEAARAAWQRGAETAKAPAQRQAMLGHAARLGRVLDHGGTVALNHRQS